MSNKLRLVVFSLALLSINWPVFSEEMEMSQAIELGLFASTPEQAERLVLVLHAGRSGSHLQTSARVNMYRARGTYADSSWNRKTARKIAKRHGMTYVADWWMSEIAINCAVFRIPAQASQSAMVEELMADNEIKLAESMSVFATLAHGEAETYSDPYFYLQSSAKHIELEKMHALSTGKDINIAVIDTGIQVDHPDLIGQVVENYNFVDAISPSFKDDTHGTAVAGLISAKINNNEGIVGIAPGAKIIGLKACWPIRSDTIEARCNSFSLALALNKALSLDVDIINLSLAGPHDKVIKLLVDEAVARGIVTVAAVFAADVGNDVAQSSFPASVPGVIAVASEGTLSGTSTLGLHEVVTAPGMELITTIPHSKYNFLSGSSFASAQVAGYIALLKETRPYLTIGELRDKLIAHSKGVAGRSVPLSVTSTIH